MINIVEQEQDLEKSEVLCDTPKEITLPVLNSSLNIKFDCLAYLQNKNENLLQVLKQDSSELRLHQQIKTELNNFIAENALRKNENSKENLQKLYDINTVSSIRKLAGFYIAQKDYKNAKDALQHFKEEHKEIPYEIYAQYALIYIEENNLNKAIHYQRKACFTSNNNSELNLLLAILYLVASLQNKKLLKKAFLWCKISCINDCANIYALKLLIAIFLKEEPEFAKNQLYKFINLKESEKNDFYLDAKVFYAKCFFVQNDFYECLTLLQELTQEPKITVAVWNNIALCNESTNYLERAERNIKKSLEKYKELKINDSKVIESILTNYMRILNKQNKYAETQKVFTEWNKYGNFELSENSYINYFHQYLKAIIQLGNLDDFFEFTEQAFNLCNNSKIKKYVCDDIVRICSAFNVKKELLQKYASFTIDFYNLEKDKKEKYRSLNNLVYALLEAELKIPDNIFKSFVSTINCSPFNTATFGLYQFRVLHNEQKGVFYYNKAIQMIYDSKEKIDVTEFELKRDLESAKILFEQGNQKEAKHLIESVIKKANGALSCYKSAVKSITTCF